MPRVTHRPELRPCANSFFAAALAFLAAPALAQSQPDTTSPVWVRSNEDFDSPQVKAQAALIKQQKAAEVEMRKIRRKYLGDIRVTSIRQEGISKLVAFNDPIHYPALIDVCKGEGDDVRGALLELFSVQAHDAANASMAWMAINDPSPTMRARASTKLHDRLGESNFQGVSSRGVSEVIQRALESGREPQMEAAAELAQILHMYEAVAWLIPAQLGQTASGGSGEGGGDLAWIAIGKQTAFVSNVTPVVGTNAVAFDPTLSVITEGVLLRVHDAAVTTYRVGINRRLIAMSSEATGQSTAALAWDAAAWQRWYNSEFYPLAARRRAEVAAQAKAHDQPLKAPEIKPESGQFGDPSPDRK